MYLDGKRAPGALADEQRADRKERVLPRCQLSWARR